LLSNCFCLSNGFDKLKLIGQNCLKTGWLDSFQRSVLN